jgi:outer membrane protein
MKTQTLAAITLAALFGASAAQAQFYGIAGYSNVNPTSDNGVLAGADAEVNDDWSFTGALGYRFNPNFTAELGTALVPFKHTVKLDGLGNVASLKHRPTTVSMNYQFMADSKFRPYVSLGYGWVSISDEKTQGPLTGLDINVENSNGLIFGAGADFTINDNLFFRAELKKLNFDSNVSVETLGNVGKAEVDPLIFGLSLGYQF